VSCGKLGAAQFVATEGITPGTVLGA